MTKKNQNLINACTVPAQTNEKFRAELPEIVNSIVKSCDSKQCYDHVDTAVIPSRESVIEIIEIIKDLLFPGYFGQQEIDRHTLHYHIGNEVIDLYEKLSHQITSSIIHEGDVKEGARTLLVEDLTTDGRSKINFCQALRNAGAVVDHVFVNFYYDIFPESKTILADLGVRLHHLATWWDVLAVVKQGGYLPAPQISEVEKFLNAPAQWSAEHGGAASSPSS